MDHHKCRPLSTAQIASAVVVLPGMGMMWPAVPMYGIAAKSIDGEWGYLIVVAVGLGFGLLIALATSPMRCKDAHG